MYNFAKRVTSAVVAGAVVLGTLAFYPGWNKGLVFAASLGDSGYTTTDGYNAAFDTVGTVNYNTVLGRATAYGIVADVWEQNNHSETNFAVNKFVHKGSAEGHVLEPDLAGTAPLSFLVGDIDGKLVFGQATYEQQNVKYVIHTSQALKNDYDSHQNDVDNSDAYKDAKISVQNIEGKASLSVDSLYSSDSVTNMITHVQTESDNLATKSSTIDIIKYEKAHPQDKNNYVLDLDVDDYDGKVVYITVPYNSVLGEIFKDSEGLSKALHVRKKSATNIVFNFTDAEWTTVCAKGPLVHVADKTFNFDEHFQPVVYNNEEYIVPETIYNADNIYKYKNKIVEEEIVDRIIFNFPNSKTVNVLEGGGAYLAPRAENSEVMSTSSGWFVTGGRFVNNKCEWHFLNGDRANSLFFSGQKKFTESYTNHKSESPEVELYDYSGITYNDGDFNFTLYNADSSYNLGSEIETTPVSAAGDFSFKPLDGLEPGHTYYFVIKETADTIAGITNSDGEIDIQVEVYDKGQAEVGYRITSRKYLTAADKANGISFRSNDNREAQELDFYFGSVYNLVTPETGSLTVTKVLSDEKPANAPTEYTFYVKCGTEGYVQNATTGAVAANKQPFTVIAGDTTGTVISGLKLDKTYTVEEADVTGLPADWSCTASYSKSSVDLTSNHKDDSVQITNNFEQKTTPVPTGSLVVSKTISGAPLNELETISFTVVDGANNALTDADGNTVTIPDLTTANVTAGLWKDSGDGKTFTYTVGNLAEGTKCTVTETYNETANSKYTLITTGTNASTMEATVTIEANKEKKAEITNNFEQKTTPAPATGTIEITKNIQGVTDTTVVGKLTFEISSDVGYSATVTYPDDFSGNTWSDTVPVGTYTVKETNKGGTSEYLIDTYSVNNKGIGSDEDSLQLATNGTVSFEFTNVYKDNSTAAEKTLVINKVFDGITVSQASCFGDEITFVITQTSGTGFNGDQPLTVYYSQFTNGTYLISGVPDGEYTVEETTFGGTSTYSYVATTTNGTQGATSATVDFANITDNKAEFTFVNEYKDNSAGSQTPGSLVIYKTVDGNIPSGADSATYYFYVTGPSYPNGTTVSVVAGSSVPLDNLIPGDYTVSEDRASAKYPDYTLNVSGESTVGVSAGSASDCTITNSYTKDGVTPGPGPGPGPVTPSTGYISFSKTFGGDVTEAEAAGCGLYFVITNEAGEYLDLDGNISSDEVRITLKDMDHTDGTLVWSKTINDVPFGTYYVTEHNEVIYINGGKVPYTFDKTTSLTTDHTSLEKASPDGTFVLENYYTHPGFDVTISKEDIAGKEIAQAQLKFKSLDGYDLSKVVVTQNGVPVQFTLSENNTAITFTTIEGYPSIIQGLFSGRYELEETVTPEAYLTAEKIVFVLNNDGTITDGEGKISAYGSPVVMIDQADPYYDTEVISANRTPSSLPATGEKTSIFAIAGTMLLGLFAAIVAGIGVYRKKKDGI